MKKWLPDIFRRGGVGANKSSTLPPKTGNLVRDYFFARWDWKFDGRLAGFIAVAYFYNRFGPNGRIKEFACLFAILFCGIILKRNLRRDVKWKELPDALRRARSK
jgi:hypothetical protein